MKYLVQRLLSLSLLIAPVSAFTATTTLPRRRSHASLAGTTTMDPPVKEKADQASGFGEDIVDDDSDDYDDLEYLIDSMESREMEDPFHILLLGATFEKPKITVPYVSGSLEYVLDMPSDDATELSTFARDQGMSCLGTWPREKCLGFGKQLQRRDIVCRVVPYVDGGQRSWQAKDAEGSRYSKEAS